MKSCRFIALLLIVAILLGGCKQKKNNDKINIGVIVPLTGQLSYTGEFVQEALNMSVDTSKVNLIFEDCKGTTKDGITATKTAIQKGAKIIVSMTSFIAEAINPICQQKGCIHFAFAFSPALAEKNNVLENFPSSTAEADWAYNKIIAPTLKNKHITIFHEPFQPDNMDFKNNMLRVKKNKPELLIVQSYAYHFSNIIGNYKSLSIETPILCDLNYLDVFSFGPDAVKNLEDIPFLGVDFVITDAYEQYTKLYKERYNKIPYAYSAYAYDLGVFFNQLAENKIL